VIFAVPKPKIFPKFPTNPSGAGKGACGPSSVASHGRVEFSKGAYKSILFKRGKWKELKQKAVLRLLDLSPSNIKLVSVTQDLRIPDPMKAGRRTCPYPAVIPQLTDNIGEGDPRPMSWKTDGPPITKQSNRREKVEANEEKP